MFTIGVVASVKICRDGVDTPLGRPESAPDGPGSADAKCGSERGAEVALDDERDPVTAAHGPAPQEGSTT
ncbi:MULTISPECIES: hypothetical protein [Halorubrum]|uniref:Uncharacterized protein n=1 Tax=Halorubrum sodomense TaxID=35743 RepID=A0A1I6GV15_HALSD|nr:MULTISPECIES: hypothetical protein [Halorubrum]TKX54736.1 hypothetical protein EXE42_06370 [Halorubrum sp. SP3]SFR46000.1 hypothetical protein SAMN04487937_2085 [Halorubrum sodomense]